jgi:squalene-hopene/tetraprenyl-beta-curcumene cyclase
MDPASRRAIDWLLARQDPAGWWCGELETNVTMTAEHILLLTFLGLNAERDRVRVGAIRHIVGCRRDDGSWSLFHNGPADLSTTIEAYVALKVLGVDPDSEPMRHALNVIVSLGGVARARVFTKIWLAMFGCFPWAGVPTMPPELIYFPPNMPFNLYDFACWARGTIAPLLIVISRRPRRALGCTLDELIVPGSEPLLRRVPGSGFFWWLDKALKGYERLPVHPGRGRARRLITKWIIDHQEADGSWGGIQPPWVYSLIALNLEGMGVDHPVMRKGIEGLRGFEIEDDKGWRFQACMSPVWDTAWAMLALRRAGVESEHPSIRRAADWILTEQIQGGGDWQVRTGKIPGGGWAFEFENDTYPDIDDTAVVVLALLQAGDRPGLADAVRRAVTWTMAVRSKNGAWGAFDKDNTRELVYRLPFADFGALLDPPSEDVTAHVLEMLAYVDTPNKDAIAEDALAYLRRMQRADGSWFGRWGVNYIYGTWCVVTALAALRDTRNRTTSGLTGERRVQASPTAGRSTDAGIRRMIDRGASWMLSHQNDDGGWGESCWSYNDPSFAGIGPSTPSQTAWAVLTLQAAGLGEHPAIGRGLQFLRDRQVDGTWDEPQCTGTGFPRDFYINYHLYRHLFPLMALAGGALPPPP